MADDLGRDLSCVEDCTSDYKEVTGRRGLAEAIARRLSTARATLLDDANYGFDLRAYLNDDAGPADLAAAQAGAEAECLKEERVLSAGVLASLDSEGVFRVDVSLEDATGPFRLTLSVTDVTVELMSVRP